MQYTNTEKKRVVILGAGYGGTALAKLLDPHFAVTLIEQREQFFHNVGSLRAAVDSSWLSTLFIPYDRLLHNGHLIHNTVSDITQTEVRFKTGETLPFDYLVLATGSNYPFPAKMPFHDMTHAHALVVQVNERIRRAQRILLIGAGPVGIEFAGEIASVYPDKRITLIDVAPRLLGQFHPKMGQLLLKDLHSLGVEVILGESLQNVPDETNALDGEPLGMCQFVTTTGRVLDADLYFVCFGVQPNTSYLRPHFADSLDERGFVKVNQYLQVESYPSIFALGDMTNVKETKMAQTASAQAKSIAESLKRLSQKASTSATLKAYTPRSTVAAIVPVGPRLGAVHLPFGKGLVLGAFAASRIKGKTLLANRYWKELGMTFPSSPQERRG